MEAVPVGCPFGRVSTANGWEGFDSQLWRAAHRHQTALSTGLLVLGVGRAGCRIDPSSSESRWAGGRTQSHLFAKEIPTVAAVSFSWPSHVSGRARCASENSLLRVSTFPASRSKIPCAVWRKIGVKLEKLAKLSALGRDFGSFARASLRGLEKSGK